MDGKRLFGFYDILEVLFLTESENIKVLSKAIRPSFEIVRLAPISNGHNYSKQIIKAITLIIC